MNIVIRSYHLDGYGHVNNARYLEFLEEARWGFFERTGLSEYLNGIQMVVSRADIRYRRSARQGDVLIVETCVSEVLLRQIKFRQIMVFQDTGKVAIEADVTLMGVQNGKAVSLPEPLRILLDGLVVRH